MSLPSTTPPSKPTSSISEPYEIKVILESDTERVLKHLRQVFFKEEPLNVAVNLIESEDETCIDLEKFLIEPIKDNLSLMAVTQSGQIIAVCINKSLKRSDPEVNEDSSNPKFAKILGFLKEVDKKVNIFGRYPNIDKIFFVKFMSVDVAWRGKGITKALKDKAEEIGRATNHGLLRADCSSYYSAKLVEKFGYECIFTMKFSDYKINGESVICPADPHKDEKIFVIKL